MLSSIGRSFRSGGDTWGIDRGEVDGIPRRITAVDLRFRRLDDDPVFGAGV